jgi:hypothetical protein
MPFSGESLKTKENQTAKRLALGTIFATYRPVELLAGVCLGSTARTRDAPHSSNRNGDVFAQRAPWVTANQNMDS